jgi:hypothetical protein
MSATGVGSHDLREGTRVLVGFGCDGLDSLAIMSEVTVVSTPSGHASGATLRVYLFVTI